MSNRNGGRLVAGPEEMYTPVIGNITFLSCPDVEMSASASVMCIKTRYTTFNPETCEKIVVGQHLSKNISLTGGTELGVIDAPYIDPCFPREYTDEEKLLSNSDLSNVEELTKYILTINSTADAIVEPV
jgi:hypothetical protein